jgi:hypothetical protein
MFQHLGFTEEAAMAQFGFLLKAFEVSYDPFYRLFISFHINSLVRCSSAWWYCFWIG